MRLLALAALVAVAPTPAWAGKPGPIRRVETAEPVVALTFDACATRGQANGFDRAAWEILKAEKVPITVFVTGRWLEAHEAEAAELARDPLVTFGDHSYDHARMPKLSAARMGDEIDKTEAALARLGKKSVAFRPPAGEWNRKVLDVARARGLPTVTWDVVSGDPSKHTTTTKLLKNVLGPTRAGSIVIFHINARGRHTAEALPTILRDLRARGLRFVPLPELLSLGTAI